MLLGTVVGQVWATVKDPTLEGCRFIVVQPWTLDERAGSETLVAVDRLGAGIGERVLVVFGRAARHVIGKGHDIGFQSAVAAIIDRAELQDGRSVGPTRAEDRGPQAERGLGPGRDPAPARIPSGPLVAGQVTKAKST
jgi:ethanolamine utilization protein EutN